MDNNFDKKDDEPPRSIGGHASHTAGIWVLLFIILLIALYVIFR